MSGSDYLTNHFLIAMPALQDPNFQKTVTFVCEHNNEGAMGIVINRPMSLHLSDLLEQMEIKPLPGTPVEQTIFVGGPVAMDRGFVLHRGGARWDSTLEIAPNISITTSRDILEAIAEGTGPAESLVALGYAGWGSGQLENEMAQNAWLSTPADLEIIFQLPVEQRWRAAARLIGVDLDSLSQEAGHA